MHAFLGTSETRCTTSGKLAKPKSVYVLLWYCMYASSSGVRAAAQMNDDKPMLISASRSSLSRGFVMWSGSADAEASPAIIDLLALLADSSDLRLVWDSVIIVLLSLTKWGDELLTALSYDRTV
jgi:hypothetical protein